MIRSLSPNGIAELEELQMATLRGSLPTVFGSRFFRLYYESLMADPRFFCDGFFWESRLVGFLSYTSDSGGLLSAALRRRFFAYAWTVGLSVLKKPKRLTTAAHVLGGVSQPGAQPGSDVKAELLSYGVLPEFRRSAPFHVQHGIHVAQQLLHGAFRNLAGAGAAGVKIFIRLEEDDPFINRFYRREGFQFVGTVKRLGLPCNLYVRPLARESG